MAKPKVLVGKKLERARALLAKGWTIARVAKSLKVSTRPVGDVKHRRLAYAE